MRLAAEDLEMENRVHVIDSGKDAKDIVKAVSFIICYDIITK